ncbi:MAG TPA: glycosyltransferase [Candidatus Omnitrophota bacterium]|nr:glycosyltransferase [Candidatus Omnitrophota bacterium]
MDNSAVAVSVVMSVFNGQRYLRQAIESVLRQAGVSFEFIVIDDASSDATAQILAGYSDPRIRIIRNERNLGLPLSLNKGIALARGAMIARQDADDISLPGRLQKQLVYLEEHPGCALVGSDFFIIDDEDHLLAASSLPSEDQRIRAVLETKNCFAHSAMMFRKAAFDAVGGYRREFPGCLDYDLALRLSQRYALANLPERLLRYRVHPQSMSAEKSARMAFERSLIVLAWQKRRRGESDAEVLKTPLPRLKEDPRRLLAGQYYGFADSLYAGGDARAARRFSWKSLCLFPFHRQAAGLLLRTWLPGAVRSWLRNHRSTLCRK